jgi:class 3 adenylate cyclase
MYSREKQLRLHSNLAIIANKELTKTEKLLTQMIPAHVYKHLKEENTVTDMFPQVTLIYADIVGFTPWSSGREAAEIVNMLSSLFTKFDESSVNNDVYKVHTIGDCYVAMGYHGAANRNPVKECENLVNFAYSLLSIIKEVSKEHKELNMRIGVHTGDVIGGVMGTSIVRYDIYGTDVLIANQMESSGIPGRIVISETTKQFLEQAQPRGYTYELHTEVNALDRKCKAYTLTKNL